MPCSPESPDSGAVPPPEPEKLPLHRVMFDFCLPALMGADNKSDRYLIFRNEFEKFTLFNVLPFSAEDKRVIRLLENLPDARKAVAAERAFAVLRHSQTDVLGLVTASEGGRGRIHIRLFHEHGTILTSIAVKFVESLNNVRPPAINTFCNKRKGVVIADDTDTLVLFKRSRVEETYFKGRIRNGGAQRNAAIKAGLSSATLSFIFYILSIYIGTDNGTPDTISVKYVFSLLTNPSDSIALKIAVTFFTTALTFFASTIIYPGLRRRYYIDLDMQ